MDLALTLDVLPESAKKLAIKIGSKRNKLQNVVTLEPLPDESEILDTLESYGYGSEYPFARLMWYDENRRCVKSLSLSVPIEEEPMSDHRATLDCLLSMAQELRRFVQVQNEGNSNLMTTVIKLQEKNELLREEVSMERTTAMALNLTLEQMEAGAGDNYKERGIAALLELAKAHMGRLSPEQLRDMIIQNPAIIDSFIQDEKMVSLIQERMLLSQKES